MASRVTLRIACLLPCPGIDMAFPVAGHLSSRVRFVPKARVRSQRPADIGVLSVNHCAVMARISICSGWRLVRLRIPRSHPPEKPREMIRHHPIEKGRVFDRHACLSRFRRRIPPRKKSYRHRHRQPHRQSYDSGLMLLASAVRHTETMTHKNLPPFWKT